MNQNETDFIAASQDMQDDRLISAIGYLGILCLLPLLLRKESAFAQHHGKQGLVILLVWLALWFGMIIPFLGQIVWALGSLVLIILVILGMVNALQGKMWELPVLGKYAKQIKL
ncbi:hypothetical protein EPN81_02335 [Patescibacteria group bacterium]|nr:MAG: hypothetical protein EPN81_02335 [Patescibacteria group bacterium]